MIEVVIPEGARCGDTIEVDGVFYFMSHAYYSPTKGIDVVIEAIKEDNHTHYGIYNKGQIDAFGLEEVTEEQERIPLGAFNPPSGMQYVDSVVKDD